jgi:aminoglycoside phosphotransferase family enzyme
MEFKLTDPTRVLKREEAFPHAISYVKIVETHISWIILTGNIAYKIKKPVRFGSILDFSNLHLRKKFCKRELELNQNACGQMYLCLVKLVKNNENFKLVHLNEKGAAVEYAIKMKEIPQKLRLDNLLRLNKLNNHTLDLLTQNLVKFHNIACTDKTISSYGRPQIMKNKIRENFQTISKIAKIDGTFEQQLVLFVEKNQDLFYMRRKARRIRDIHGDLYLKNIFYDKRKFYMYDRLEFNDSLRYADIAEDVAHLAMDIHFHQREDLQSSFISKYVDKSNDISLPKMIYFMMCFKACVRAKVSLFRSAQCSNLNEKSEFVKEANDHFTLAEKYLTMF